MHLLLAQYWVAAAESGFAKPGDWQTWADRIILAMEKPALWVLDLATAKDAGAVRSVLIELSTASEWRGGVYLPDSIMGFLWLRYRRGELSLEECLERVSQQDEDFWDYLGQLEAGEDRMRVETSAQTHLKPLASDATAQWDALAKAETL